MKMQPPSPQQQAQSQTKTAAQERPAGASGASLGVTIAPSQTLDGVSSGPPENVAIDPAPDADNDASLTFEWKPVKIGSNQTWGFTVSSADGASLSAVVEQGVYRKSLQGEGTLSMPVIPAAANGTTGSLSVKNETTGATARFTWQWQPAGAIARVSGGVSKGAQAKQNATARSQSQSTKQSKAQQARTRGSAQTQFFGQVAMGRRFAFILDKSGSMQGQRWATCTQELINALNALSGDAEFFVVLFSSGIFEPPGQKGWMEANADNVASVIKWVSGMYPDGGTEPGPAFKRVFSLPNKADAVYFLTDGELFGFNASDCRRLLQGGGSGGGFFSKLFGGRRDQDDWDPVINTISLDDDSSARELKKMAEDTGGSYVHIRSS
jgi:hypothetical protein